MEIEMSDTKGRWRRRRREQVQRQSESKGEVSKANLPFQRQKIKKG